MKILTSFAFLSSLILVLIGGLSFVYPPIIKYLILYIAILVAYHSGMTYGRSQANRVSYQNLLTPIAVMVILSLPMETIQLLLCMFLFIIQYLFDKLTKPVYEKRQLRSRFFKMLLVCLVCLTVLLKDYLPDSLPLKTHEKQSTPVQTKN